MAQLPRLGPPVGVDLRVETVQWHPAGLALMYTRQTQEGPALGVFTPGQKEGKALIQLAKEDRFEMQWFDAIPGAAVIVYRTVDGSPDVSIYIVDAKAQAAKQVYAGRVAPGQQLSINVDPSPTIYHAIFRVRSMGKTTHMVLTTNANRLVPAPNLDQAVAEGWSGPTWSLDGTAVYARTSSQKASAIEGRLLTELVISQRAAKNDVPVLSSLPIIGANFRLPRPAVGAEVFELLPSNGVLRPVRFRGAWEPPVSKTIPFETRVQAGHVQFGASRAGASSLWLTEGGKPAKTEGVLVSAGAGQSWVAPLNRGVAYTVDGVLFVRMVGG